MKNAISRRSFLKAVGIMSAAGALAACFNVRHRQIAPRLNAVYTVFYRSLKLGQR